jgi:hypothetical protein
MRLRDCLRSLLAAFGLAAAAGPAGAVTIDVRTVDRDGGPTSVIVVEGEFVYGDEKAFIQAALNVPEGFVVLSSPGGNVHAAIEIGKAIRLKGLKTAVLDGATCASACAIAWLGGNTRYMGRNAQVGFHAVTLSNDPKHLADSVGNALVGAYLGQLNLSTPAIAYITQAQPDDMRWLTVEDAREVGIEVSDLTPAEVAGLPAEDPGRIEPAKHTDPFEPGERSRRFVPDADDTPIGQGDPGGPGPGGRDDSDDPVSDGERPEPKA